MNHILSKSEEGTGLVKYYENKKKLLPEQRKLLVKLIVDHLVIASKKRVPNSHIGDISRQIAIVFSTENKEDFQKKVGKQTVGLLQTAYNNRLTAIAKKKKKIEAWGENQTDEVLSDADLGEYDGMLRIEISFPFSLSFQR